MRWEEGTFEIVSLNKITNVLTFETIEGPVSGPFGIEGDGGLEFLTLVHIPTGRRIYDFETAKKAKNAAGNLVKETPGGITPWESEDIRSKEISEAIRQGASIVFGLTISKISSKGWDEKKGGR